MGTVSHVLPPLLLLIIYLEVPVFHSFLSPEKTDIVEPVLRLQLGFLALQGWLGSGEAVCHLPWHAAPRCPDSPVRATLLDAFL